MRNVIARFLLCLSFLASLAAPSAGQAAADAPNTGVYAEDFSTYQTKDFTQSAVWDPWAGQVRLQRSATDAFMPAMAAAPGGGAYAAFTRMDGIYVQRFDARGARLWPAAVKLSNGVIEAYMLNNQITAAALPDGGAVVAWFQGSLLAQRISADGAPVWDEPLEVSPQADAWATPSVSVYPDGSLLLAWSHNGAWARRVSAAGDFVWPDPVTAARNGGEQKYARASLDAAGNALVAWYRPVDDATGNIFAQSLDPDGNYRWAADTQVNAESGVVMMDYGATLSLDCAPDGSAVLSWTSIYHQGERIASAQRLDAAGTQQWAADARISSYNDSIELAHLDTNQPAVAVDASGGALISFQADTPAGERIQMHAMYLTPAGERAWAEDAELTTDQPVVFSTPHTLSILPTGEAWAGWYQGESESHPYAMRLDSTGKFLLESPVPVMDDSGLSTQTAPALAADPDGGALIAWEDNRRGRVDVYLTRNLFTGDPAWETDLRVNSDDPAARSDTNPHIAVSPDGSVLVTFQRRYDNNYQLFAQKFDRNGNRLWPAEIALSTRSQSGFNSVSLAAGPDGSFVYAWVDYLTIGSLGVPYIIAQKLDPDGSKLWQDGIAVSAAHQEGGPLLTHSNPTVRIGADGHAWVLWMSAVVTGSLPDDWRVSAQRLSPDGTRQWPQDLLLSSPESEPQLFSLAVGALYPDGSLFAGWAVQPIGLAGQRAYPDGTLAWAGPQPLDDFFYPSDAAPAPDGGIYLSGVTGAETPASLLKVDDVGEVTIPTPTYPNPPRLAYWRGETPTPMLAAYTTSGTDPDVEITTLEPIPGFSNWPPIALAEPEEFFLERGLVQSLTVDTFTENIARATLTATKELNGGEVIFSLSNDGGATWQPALPGVAVTFPGMASDLRWRAELVRDPAWPRRSPLIDSVRIEYSAEIPNADRYETDDTCEQAVTIETGGVSQRHTLHAADDVDWIKFDGVKDQPLLIQASEPEANADVQLELYAGCPAGPAVVLSNPYNGEAQFFYIPPQDGTVYAAARGLGAGGAESGYSLSVRVMENTPIVAIVAGPAADPAVQQALQASADRLYRLFLKSTPRSNIRYLAPDPARDADGNGAQDDIYGAPSRDLLRDTIQDWARLRGAQIDRPFYLFILGDGQPGELLSGLSGGSVSPDLLDLWLSNLEDTTGVDRVSVILEASESGEFLTGDPAVVGPKRVVIASAGPGEQAHVSAEGAYFTNALAAALDERLSLREAFDLAAADLAERGLPQTPMLDDNGDGQVEPPPGSPAVLDPAADEPAGLPDGLAASARGLRLMEAAQLPVVDQVTVSYQAGGTLQVTVRARASAGVKQVWLEAYPAGDGGSPLVAPGSFAMQPVSGKPGLYTLSGLSPVQFHRLVAVASDTQNQRSRPVTVLAHQQIFLPVMSRK